MNCSRLKETKETLQIHAIFDSMQDPVLEGKNAIKDIIGSTGKTGTQMAY